MPSEGPLDSMSWYELLLPFIGVKKLHIGSYLTCELSQALESVSEGLVQELLPELEELEVQLDIDNATRAFSTFLKTRESTGHPVLLKVSFASLHTNTYLQRALSQTTGSFDMRSFCKYKDSQDGSYRYQAMRLINIYRSLSMASMQSHTQDVELRR